MLIWSFLIPVLTCIILWVWFKEETTWWEYLVVFIPSILSSLIIYFIIKEIKVSDHRYTSEVVVSLDIMILGMNMSIEFALER